MTKPRSPQQQSRCPTAARTEGGWPVKNPYVDRHGQDLVGEDEGGLWWGTPATPLPVYEGPHHPRQRVRRSVYGTFPDGTPYEAHLVASSVRAIRRHAESMRLRDVTIELTHDDPYVL